MTTPPPMFVEWWAQRSGHRDAYSATVAYAAIMKFVEEVNAIVDARAVCGGNPPLNAHACTILKMLQSWHSHELSPVNKAVPAVVNAVDNTARAVT